MTQVLALIPARGGSKSIPRKNIRTFAGFPLIAFSIAAGLGSETITRVIVSSDDEEIAAVSRRFGLRHRSSVRRILPKTARRICLSSSMHWNGFRRMRLISLRSSSSSAPLPLYVECGISIRQSTACLNTPKRMRFGPYVPRSKTHTKCGGLERTG